MERHNRLTIYVVRLTLTLPTKSAGDSPTERDTVFQPEFREDLRCWVETNRPTALRIFTLIEAIMRDPLTGIGKPERLKYLGTGVWSRRITAEHRLVYLVCDDQIDFIQARYHY